MYVFVYTGGILLHATDYLVVHVQTRVKETENAFNHKLQFAYIQTHKLTYIETQCGELAMKHVQKLHDTLLYIY